MEGVWLMLNQKEPKEYVLGSGKMHTVRDFIKLSLKHLNIPYKITYTRFTSSFIQETKSVIYNKI